MTASPARILAMRECSAMVALDTMPHLVTRIRNLLSHGRRITMTQRYTYVDRPPEVTAGLTVDTRAYDGGISEHRRDDGHHFGVRLRPGAGSGFGLSAYACDGNRTEAEAWKRYHAGKDATDVWAQRRNMTVVEIVGGLPGDGPARDDRLIVREWNDSGVCDERVIVFDGGPRDAVDRAAGWLWANALGPAHAEVRLREWERGTVPDDEVKVWEGRAVELLAVVADEGR
ncbi:hypothetical protein [Micromonospora sp. NPDC049891]|uniref:hypothetical protein n=1 Tax=Micromonospora sp. NPDC049891 TaxID=3155655 RepID=UPI0033C9BC67